MRLWGRDDRDSSDTGAGSPFDPSWDVPASFNFTRDVVDGAARARAGTALTSVDGDGTITRASYGDLARSSTRWGLLLAELAPERPAQAVVALSGEPRAAAFLGALKAGILAVPMADSASGREQLERAAELEADVLLTESPDLASERETQRDSADVRPAVVGLADIGWRLQRPSGGDSLPATAATDAAFVLFTRGRATASRPVVHSHAAAWSAGPVLAEWLGVGPRDVVFCGSGLPCWADVLLGMLGTWGNGAELLELSPRLDPAELSMLLERYGPTVLIQTPSDHAALLDAFEAGRVSLPNLRAAGSVGGVLPDALARRFEKLTGVPLRDGYGMAETGLVLLGRQGAPGALEPLELLDLWVAGEAAHDTVGQPGRLVMDGSPPALFLGYWPDILDLRNARNDDAWWVPTEDTFVMADDGTFTLGRRTKGDVPAS